MKLACRKIARGIGGKLFILFQNSLNARADAGWDDPVAFEVRVRAPSRHQGGQKVLRNAL